MKSWNLCPRLNISNFLLVLLFAQARAELRPPGRLSRGFGSETWSRFRLNLIDGTDFQRWKFQRESG